MAQTITLTMVLPAPSGCNLKCPFCAIAQRGETQDSILEREDYLRFLNDAAAHLSVVRVSVQGHEPLLPEVWELTRTLLLSVHRLPVGRRIVTNGTYLAEHAYELSGLSDTVAVSLDSADANIHERLRGVPGCFVKTVQGIEAAVSSFGPEGVVVNSVLFPGKAEHLRGMPEFLVGLGVKEWSISPYKNMRAGGNVGDKQQLKKALLKVMEEGERAGLRVFLADELRRLGKDCFYDDILTESLEQETFVVRLSPDGSCSRGMECFESSSLAPVWNRVEEPHQFLRRILTEVGQAF